MIRRRLTPLTCISVRVAACLRALVRSKSEAARTMTSWAQAEEDRQRLPCQTLTPSTTKSLPVFFYYYLPTIFAKLDIGSPLTSTVTSLETPALHCATLPHTTHHASHIFHAPVARSHRFADPEPSTTFLVYQVRQILWQSQHW